MTNILVYLLLFVCVSAVFSMPVTVEKVEAERIAGEVQEIVHEELEKYPKDEKLAKKAGSVATGNFVKLPKSAMLKLRDYNNYGPYACYAPDCNRACRAYGYFQGQCVTGGCFCVYFDYYDYTFY